MTKIVNQYRKASKIADVIVEATAHLLENGAASVTDIVDTVGVTWGDARDPFLAHAGYDAVSDETWSLVTELVATRIA